MTVRALASPARQASLPAEPYQPRPLCRGRSEWTSECPDDQVWAASVCLECPLRDDCREWVKGETAGVWGGLLARCGTKRVFNVLRPLDILEEPDSFERWVIYLEREAEQAS